MLTLIGPSAIVGDINLQTFKPAPERAVDTIAY